MFGDIGTSPLYALKECFHASHGIPINTENVLGILSLIFWALTIVVSLKYIAFIMRADNNGEGGIMALLALTLRTEHKSSRRRWFLIGIGIFGAALFFGDGIITPAISVLSAIEGLKIAAPALGAYVVPLTIGVLIGLFLIQQHGTGRVGTLFGPIMMLWFSTLGVLGVINIGEHTEVLQLINPLWAARFIIDHGMVALVVLGAVVLTITGGEALYADMGHFGRKPIRYAWFGVVLPALLLNYCGQGALLLSNPSAVGKPLLSIGTELGLVAAGGAGDGRCGDRFAGGDFRRVFDRATSGATRLFTAHGSVSYLDTRNRSDLYSGAQLVFTGLHYRLSADL